MAENSSSDTTLGYLRCVIDFTPEMEEWLETAARDEWFAEEDGNAFLREYLDGWHELLLSVAEEEIAHYLHELGVPETAGPFVRRGDSYIGCGVIEVLIVGATILAAYPAAKEIGRDLVGGLRRVKRSITRRLRPEIEHDAHIKLESHAEPLGLEPLPERVLWIIFVMDLRALET